MRIGKLRHLVRIEHIDYVRDSNGDVIRDPVTGEMARDWQELATTWASIEPVSAREFVQSGALQSQVTTRIVMRYRDDVDASMRIVYERAGLQARIYNIQGVLPDLKSGREYVTLPCREGTNEG